MQVAIGGFLVGLFGLLRVLGVIHVDVSSDAINMVVGGLFPIVAMIVSTYFGKKRIDDGKDPNNPLPPIRTPAAIEAIQRATKG